MTAAATLITVVTLAEAAVTDRLAEAASMARSHASASVEASHIIFCHIDRIAEHEHPGWNNVIPTCWTFQREKAKEEVRNLVCGRELPRTFIGDTFSPCRSQRRGGQQAD